MSKSKIVTTTGNTMLAVLALQLLPALAAAQAPSTGSGQAAYPVKAIRVAVGFPAGGPADTMARIIGKKMTELSGQLVIVENRPGANGFIAAEYVAKSAPDGYTQVFASGSMLSFTKYLYTKPLVDPDRDLALVTQAVSVPQIFVVHPSLPVKSMKDLAQLATQRPNQLNISIIGVGGLIHLGVEMFKTSAGIQMTNVQYKGAAPAIVDLIGGHVEAALFDVPAVMAYLPSGKMRALAVTSAARLKQLPQVPTTTEAGYLNVQSDSWYGNAVPVASSPDLIQRMNKLWVASVRAPETRELLYAIGVGAVGSNVEEFNAFRASEARKWGDLVRKMNLKLE
jgi:tripartite-type tricarboxylate transporter receptor subunit TctC